MKQFDTASISRYVVLVVAVINSVLNLIGYQTISHELTNDLVAFLTGAYTLYMAWKNNYISRKGVQQKEVIEKAELH